MTFSEKMQISAILCFATCDWFCPMMSQIWHIANSILLVTGGRKEQMLEGFADKQYIHVAHIQAHNNSIYPTMKVKNISTNLQFVHSNV